MYLNFVFVGTKDEYEKRQDELDGDGDEEEKEQRNCVDNEANKESI